jgi:NhaP-type Na+/H+ or K+/H+ antiporter
MLNSLNILTVFHRAHFLSDYVPESCMLIIIGILLGLALYFDNQHFYELNTTTFFLVLLPPIILDAGYFMPARPFFDQLGTFLSTWCWQNHA